MASAQPYNVAYGLSQALIQVPNTVVVSKNSPTANDKAQLGSGWVNTTTNQFFVITSIVDNLANWESSAIGNGTNGQLLIGGGSAPLWANLTAGTGISITNGVNSITLAASGSVATQLNADSGSATFSSGAATIAGGSNISTSATSHTLTVNLVNSPSVSGSLHAGTSILAGTTVTATTGLTVSSLSTGVVQSNSSGVFSSSSGTDGQILIGSSIGAPSWATITAGANVTVTNGHNTITIAAAGGSGGTVSQLSGNSGVAGPDGGGNINVIGSGNITVTGDNSHTLTATLTGTTQHAVQVGGATGALTSLSVGTNGQVLLGSTGANPGFVTPTAGTGLSITTNASTLSYALSTPVSVANGGTGDTSLTLDGVLYGNGTSAIGVTSAGTNGQVLLGATGAAPAFATLTSSGGTITYTTGANSLNIDGTAASTSQAGVVALATNAQTIAGTATTVANTPVSLKAKLGTQTSNGIAYGAGTTSALNWTSAGSNGQVLLGATSGAPAFGSITSSGGTITITTGANSLNLDVAASSANTINADSGSATFSGGAITLAGGSNISTSATSHTVTVNLVNSPSVSGSLTAGTSLVAASTKFNVRSTGIATNSGQPAFSVYANNQSNVTGDGTSNAVVFANTLFDQASNFSSNTFTAPVTGRYMFNCTISFSNVSANNGALVAGIVTTGFSFAQGLCKPSNIRDQNNNMSVVFSAFAAMNAGDTAQVSVTMYGLSKTVGIIGASSFFSGYLVC